MSRSLLRSPSFFLKVAAAALLLFSAGCLGLMWEGRQPRLDPPVSAALEELKLMPKRIGGMPPEIYFALGKPFERDADALSQGKRLYTWFGCPACHAEGEGGKGPAFLDGRWIYGPSMVSIAASIRDGRPHGMPPFRNKMTIGEIWQLAGYVKTIGAYAPPLNAPGRNDDRQTRPAENRGPAVLLFEEGSPP